MYLPLLALAAVAYLALASKDSSPASKAKGLPMLPEPEVQSRLAKTLSESTIEFVSTDGASSLWKVKPGSDGPSLAALLANVADNNRIVLDASLTPHKAVVPDGVAAEAVAQALLHESGKYLVFRSGERPDSSGLDRSHLPHPGIWHVVAVYNLFNVLKPVAPTQGD